VIVISCKSNNEQQQQIQHQQSQSKVIEASGHLQIIR